MPYSRIKLIKTYKIHFSLFIKAEKYHYSELVENCQCGECPNHIKNSDLYFMEEGSQYFFDIQKKSLLFMILNRLKIVLYLGFNKIMKLWKSQKILFQFNKKFYDEGFMSISEKEFPNGFKELEFQIENVEVSQLINEKKFYVYVILFLTFLNLILN